MVGEVASMAGEGHSWSDVKNRPSVMRNPLAFLTEFSAFVGDGETKGIRRYQPSGQGGFRRPIRQTPQTALARCTTAG